MNLVREKVIHKKYGTGEITKLDNDHVYVKFQSVDQEKIFTKEQVQDLFLSVGWGSGNYPERLYKALINS